jgi:hypothetical protein
MIIPCMNCTSAGERDGSVALVDGGSVRVGWPGAPGCTTTGLAGSACCAQTGSENRTIGIDKKAFDKEPITAKETLELKLVYYLQFVSHKGDGHKKVSQGA